MHHPSHRFATATFALLAGAAIPATLAQAQQAFEVSHDGRTTAIPDLDQQAVGVVARGSAVPFGTTPDQTVQLRRQIGGLRITDINGDGLNDLVAVCYISNSFPPYEDWHDLVFYGNGSGIDTTPGWISDVQTHAGDVQIGDLNNDGRPDVVTIHGGSPRRDSVRVYINTPAGLPTAPSYTSNTTQTAWGTAGVLADMELDGFLDLITTNQGLSPDPFRPLLMFRNTGGVLSTAAVWQSADQAVQSGIDAADLNGDGFPDLGVAKWINFNSAIYLNDAGTPFATPAATVATTGTDRGAVFADFNDDGVLELAIGGSPSTVYAYDGALTPLAVTNPPFSSPQEIKAFDINNDGLPDFAEVHFSDGRAHIYLNDGGTLATEPSWSFDAPEVGTALTFGDLNADGLADLAIGYSGNTCIRIFFAQPPACPADLNNSGDLDFFDVVAFLSLYNDEDPRADFSAPFGEINFFDAVAFLAAYNAGCP
jgi:hypothetical protein